MGIELPTIAIRVKIPSYLYVQISVKIVEAISCGSALFVFSLNKLYCANQSLWV